MLSLARMVAQPTCDKEYLSHVAETPALASLAFEMAEMSPSSASTDNAVAEVVTDLSLALRNLRCARTKLAWGKILPVVTLAAST